MNAAKKLFFLIGSGGNIYTSIPSSPVFSGTTSILNIDNGGTIESGEIGGAKDLLVPLTFNATLIPNGLIGTSGSPYRIKSSNDSERSWIGGSNITSGQQIIDDLNGSTFIRYYHLGLTGNPDIAQLGISGITARAQDPAVRKSNHIYSDIIIKDTSASIVQVNDAVLNATYDYIRFEFVRGFGYTAAQVPGSTGSQEGFYQGSTATDHNAECRFTLSEYENCLIIGKGREGFQWNNHVALSVNKCTAIDVGQTNTAGQNHLIQVQNCNGIIQNCIFYNAPAVANLALQGFTFRNCSFYFNGTQGNILRMSDYSHYDTSPMKNGQPVLFDSCYFHSFVSIASMFDVREDQCNITFTNCIKNSNITALYTDNRIDKVTFTLSNTGTVIQNNPIPTFQSTLYSNENIHGLVTTPYHYNLGQGYRTP